MGLHILIFIAALPIIIMCMYVYKKDRDKEPIKILRKLFIYGILSIFPIVLLEMLSNKITILDKSNFISLFISTFVTVGLIEEGAKWVIVNKATYNDIEFNHAYDAIVYAVFASLGFALIENLLYVLKEGFEVGILRALTTIPAHTFNGILMGYFLGLSKSEDINKNINESKQYMYYSLLIPIVTHTVYDYLIFLQDRQATIVFILFVVSMYIISFKIINNISLINMNFDGSKYNSKERKKYENNNVLFNYALSRMFVVTLVLIFISGITLLCNF